MTTFHRTISGQPYCFSECEGGWRVCPTSNQIDRIGRTYLVKCDPSGKPTQCSCPHHYHSKMVCKHMLEAAKLNPSATGSV
jgi:hypothetical protein